MEKDDFRRVGTAVHPLDISVAEAEGFLHGHPALCAEAGDHGGGDDEMVAEVGDGVVGKAADALGSFKSALAAVFLNGVDQPGGHRAVKKKFLSGLPVSGCFPVIVRFNGLSRFGMFHKCPLSDARSLFNTTITQN